MELVFTEQDYKNMKVWFNYMEQHVGHNGIIGKTHFDTVMKITKMMQN